MPDTVLSDDELNHLESKSQDTSLDYTEVDQILRRVPALCATVRALRRDVDKFSTLADERHDLLSEERRRNDGLRQHVDESQRTNETLTKRNVELRRQLAQVTQERDRLQQQLSGEQALDLIAPRTLKKEVRDAIEELK